MILSCHSSTFCLVYCCFGTFPSTLGFSSDHFHPFSDMHPTMCVSVCVSLCVCVLVLRLLTSPASDTPDGFVGKHLTNDQRPLTDYTHHTCPLYRPLNRCVPTCARVSMCMCVCVRICVRMQGFQETMESKTNGVHQIRHNGSSYIPPCSSRGVPGQCSAFVSDGRLALLQPLALPLSLSVSLPISHSVIGLAASNVPDLCRAAPDPTGR